MGQTKRNQCNHLWLGLLQGRTHRQNRTTSFGQVYVRLKGTLEPEKPANETAYSTGHHQVYSHTISRRHRHRYTYQATLKPLGMIPNPQHFPSTLVFNLFFRLARPHAGLFSFSPASEDCSTSGKELVSSLWGKVRSFRPSYSSTYPRIPKPRLGVSELPSLSNMK